MLGEKIKSYRLERGLSQEELAGRLAVVRQTVSKWEKELSLPDSEMLVKLAEVFKISAAELLGEAEEPFEAVEAAQVDEKRRLKGWEIALLVLGSPIWISLLVAALAVVLSLYISAWAVIISLWSVFGALIGCAFGGILAGGIFAFGGESPSGFAMIGAGFICAGLSILMFFGCKAATKSLILLTKKLVGRLIKKEGAE